MSWQEDLRRLDADLAAGRIEPAAHRKQRDELLAQASGSTVPSPVPSPLRRPATAWHSANPAAAPPPVAQPPVDPRTAPPQRMESPAGWHKRPQPPPPWQRTNSAAQKTLSQHGVVPPVPDHLTTAPSPADITPTRYMKVEGPAPDPISRFPPLGRPVHHRPDETEEVPGKHRSGDGRRPTWLFLGLGVLVVLAMVVGVTAWLGSGDDAPPQSAPAPVTSSASGIKPDPLEDRLPKLPGEANPNNSTLTIAKAQELKLIPAPTAELFTSNGAKEMLFRGSSDGEVNYLALVIPTGSAQNAQTVVETLYQQALTSGMRPVGADVRTISGKFEKQFLNTSWYGSGNNAVVIGVGLPYRGQSGMSGQLDGMLKQFESVLPAG